MTTGDFSSLYLALKLLGVALTAGFGMLGLLVSFKDEDGHITVWGRRALVGMFCSFGATLATELIQNSNNNRRAEIERQHQNEITQNILRAVYPLRPIRLAVKFSYPLDVVATSNYPSRVRDFFLSSRDKDCSDIIRQNGVGTINCGDRGPDELGFTKDFKLWPTLQELEFRLLLGQTSIHIGFFIPGSNSEQRSPRVSLRYARPAWPSKPNPLYAADLHVAAFRDHTLINITFGNFDEKLRATKDFRTASIQVEAFDLSGAIVSIVDLLGTSMILTIGTDLGADEEKMKRFRALRGAAELKEVRLTIDGLGEFCFAGTRFSKKVDSDGLPHFKTLFPKSLDDLRKDSILAPTAQCIND